jgi:hypothetical protein
MYSLFILIGYTSYYKHKYVNHATKHSWDGLGHKDFAQNELDFFHLSPQNADVYCGVDLDGT